MTQTHAKPIALVAAVALSISSGKQCGATGRACHGRIFAPAPGRRSTRRTTTTRLNAHEERMGMALAPHRRASLFETAVSCDRQRHMLGRDRQRHMFGVAGTLKSLEDNFRCYSYRRRQSVGGVALLSRAIRGGSSVARDSIDNTLPRADSGGGRSYHLIWSPSFGRIFLMSTITLFAMTYILTIPTISSKLGLGGVFLPSHTAHLQVGDCHYTPSSLSRSIRQLLLPLLSSSCCAVQLLINSLAGVGCAGFNTVLGPLRPVFLSFLVYSTAVSYPGGPTGLGKWYRNTALAFFFALMPELLHMWNNHSWRLRATKMTGDANFCATVQLDIPSMGCAACINKIDSTITGSSGVLNTRSWLVDDPKGGRARFVITANSFDDVDEIIKAVVEQVDSSGFPCKVDTVDVVDKRQE